MRYAVCRSPSACTNTTLETSDNHARSGVFFASVITKVCEHDHVHLLIEYPPKVAVSKLVNSLEGGVRTSPA